MTEVIGERPPNYQDIVKHFPMAALPTTIFAFAGKIYTLRPEGLNNHLITHENVHISRQGSSQESSAEWWDKYCRDEEFRFQEELVAHRVEYLSMTDESANRRERRSAEKCVAKRLASPLYGRLISMKEARRLITT